ncbi:LysR family transcriptional regulator [Paracoccus sanguinis]|uniref:LysR family transcriptional regulator n=1 Tax=Paracoccus sanguinis TaxID=1545044 RepID=UPI001451A4FB|nr:LysR family transcriptional regulator [Paracoccus sanguinis]QJD16469.1 LysR family transcriptional regulator [Paracoccus sanguinis]
MSVRAVQSLKLSQLRLIAAIDRHRQIIHAAEALGISQPAASRSLAEIERLLDAALFDRHPRGMTPTAAGEIVARRAHALLTGLSDLGRELDEMGDGLSGVVRVGAVTGPALGCVVPALRRLKALAPRIEIAVEVAPSAALLTLLEQGALDFLLARVPDGHPADGLRVEPGVAETLCCLIRRSHPLAGRDGVPMAEAARYPWVLQDRGAPIRVAVERAFWAEGLDPPVDITASSSPLLALALVQDTNALCPVSAEVARLAQGEGHRFTTLSLARPFELSPCQLISRAARSLSPAAERMRALVREEIARGGQGR